MSASLLLSRRSVLAGTGALIASFSARRLIAQEGGQSQNPAPGQAAAPPPKLPGSLDKNRMLDAWVRIDASGQVTIFTGKAELGQGIKTAILQVASEELDVPFAALKLVTADTARTPNEGYTSGSQSMTDSAVAVRNASAQVREILIAEATRRANLPAEQLKAENGAVVAPDGRRFGYGELVSDTLIHVEAQPQSKLKPPSAYTIVGKPQPRVDIPGKLTGGEAYMHDMRLPGMLHARIVRPPSYRAQLTAVDTGPVEVMSGIVKIVRDGNFLAVVAEREFQAVKAMRRLAAGCQWNETPGLPNQADLASMLMNLPSRETVIHEHRDSPAQSARTLEATYVKGYHMHGSIGPSCAVALMEGDAVTVWTHTQGVYPDRKAIAELLRMPPEKVHLVHAEGSGCYGHNGADDAAADAALIARALPGRPIRVQWMREQEHGWEPYGPAMVARIRASLDEAGKIVDWDYGVWSNTHSTRPGTAGSLIAGRTVAEPFPEPEPEIIPQPSGGGDRNAIPLYRFPSARVVHHFIPPMPLRVSATRALGAYMNVFTIESFMDELALATGADPVEFRLTYLEDPRAREVVTRAAERFGWKKGQQAPHGRGYGFAFARYKNYASYCAVAAEVEVSFESGRARLARAVAAVDSGEIVNPDGLTNQVEGAILQSASWTLFEAVGFTDLRITSTDWSSYPIMRFNAVPDSVEVELIDRPGEPYLGAGECGQGPAAGAIANALANATGSRFRSLPITRERVRGAMGA
jgi:CO/xanthine dehydrogenase Mo-binding subunit